MTPAERKALLSLARRWEGRFWSALPALDELDCARELRALLREMSKPKAGSSRRKETRK